MFRNKAILNLFRPRACPDHIVLFLLLLRSLFGNGFILQRPWQGGEAFINGQKVAVGNSPGTPAGSDVPFVLGGGIQGFDGTICCSLLGGYMRQSRVWNRALSQIEIANMMSVRLNGSENGLVAQWMLDDGAGQIATDTSINGLNLQIGVSPNSTSQTPVGCGQLS